MKSTLTLIALGLSMSMAYAQETPEEAQREAQAAMTEMEQKMEALERQMKEVERQAAELEKKAAEMEQRANEAIPAPPSIPEPDTTFVSGDTTKVRFGKNEVIVVEGDEDEVYVNWNEDEWDFDKDNDGAVNMWTNGRNRVFQGFEIATTGFSFTEGELDLNAPEGMEAYEVNMGNSWSWSINPFEADIRIINEYVKLSTGLGYTAKNFSLQNNYRMSLAGNNINPSYDSTYTLAKNRFRAGYLTVPALIHFNTNKVASRSFRVGAGVIGGLNIFRTYKTKHFDGSQKVKNTAKNGWPYSSFIADARIVVGYGNINLFGQMSMVPLFDQGKGPEVYPVMFGINFTNNYD